jgi:molybdate transport system substrate-binding protein
MENLDQEGKIIKESRATLLSNRIVTVVPVDFTFIPKSSKDLLDSKIKHLALAGESVPAGKFARAALTSEGQLDKVQEKIVNASNVRAALQWVALKEAEAGIVFQTDAKVEPKVKIAFIFPEASHPKIEYPAAIIKDSKNIVAAKSFLIFCKSKEAKAIFESEGFMVLGK